MKNPFSKPIAKIYVSEIRSRMDPLVIPMFTPDTVLDVGDFGSFEEGRFVRRGNLKTDRGIAFDVEVNERAAFEFGSSGKVSIGDSTRVPNPAGGGDLVSATLTFSRDRAIAASFKAGQERSVRDADAFADTLKGLWADRRLRSDRAVVWSVRTASGGAVVVSEEGDNTLDVSASAALLGPAAALTLGNLSAGVQFGQERKATWKMSEATTPMVVWIRLLALSSDQRSVVDGFGFEPGSPESGRRAGELELAAVSADELLAQLDG